MLFSCLADRTHETFIDTSHQACSSPCFPVSLGLRSQALTLECVSPETKGFFISPQISFNKVMTIFNRRFTRDLVPPLLHQAHIGETISLIYAPYYTNPGLVDAVLNQPLPEIHFGDLLEQLGIEKGEEIRRIEVCFGGPVEPGRGFVLHSNDFTSALNSMQIDGGFALTATMDVLEEMGRGLGPAHSIVALGYAGWGPGQLESEIAENGWLTCDATYDLVFGTEPDAQWEAALNSIGVGALTLSADAGRA